MENQMILKSGLRQLRSLKRLIITGKRLKKLKLFRMSFILVQKSRQKTN